MSTKTEVIRFTMDIPKEIHTMLKVKAAAIGKSMRDLLIESALNENKNTDIARLLKPENREILASIQRGLGQEAKTSWSEFKKKHGA